MDAVRLARRQRLDGAQSALEIEGESGRGHRRDSRNASHRGASRTQDHAGLFALAFEDREQGIRGRAARNCDADVETLGDSDRKTLPRNWMDPKTVNRDELAAESAEIE